MLEIYFKSFKKTYYLGLLIAIIVGALVTLVVSIWPEFKAQSEGFRELLNSPLYGAILGEMVNLDIATFQGFYGMYLFIYLEMILLFLGIFYGASLISREVDKNTLDMMLSLPISRTRFLSEKFLVYLTNTFFIPISAIIITYILHFTVNEEFDTMAFVYASMAYWLLFIVLGTISLFMGTVFLDSTKSFGASGVVILGMWVLQRVSGLVSSLKDLQFLSIFHYIDASSILKNGIQSAFGDIMLVSIISVLFFIGALVVFNKRDLSAV